MANQICTNCGALHSNTVTTYCDTCEKKILPIELTEALKNGKEKKGNITEAKKES